MINYGNAIRVNKETFPRSIIRSYLIISRRLSNESEDTKTEKKINLREVRNNRGGRVVIIGTLIGLLCMYPMIFEPFFFPKKIGEYICYT